MMGAGGFSSTISGAFGYVREHHAKLATVTVELMNGSILHSVAVPSREWVCDVENNASTGGFDLPPVGSFVLVFFPYGIENVTGAFVFGSFFDPYNSKHQAFLVEEEQDKITTVYAGGIKTVYDRTTGNFTVSDVDDEKLSIRVDKENGELAVTDWNDNAITLNSSGMVLATPDDTVTMDSNGIKLEAKGNTVELKTGKAVINGHLEVSQ